VLCTRADDCLIVHDVLSENAVDLCELIPALIDAPIRRLCFDFTPGRLWPQVRAVAIDSESDLHVRGFVPSGRHRFPKLAQT
jgi:hypothetical protein